MEEEEQKKVDEAIEKEKAPEQNQSTELIDKANEAAARIEAANKKMNETVEKLEKLQVDKALGGKAEITGEKQEESDEDYAKKVMSNDL